MAHDNGNADTRQAAQRNDALHAPVMESTPVLSHADGGVSHTSTSCASGLSAPRGAGPVHPIQMKANNVQMSWWSGAVDVGKGLWDTGKGAVEAFKQHPAVKGASSALNIGMAGYDTYNILDSYDDRAAKQESGDYLGAMEEEVDMFESGLDLASRAASESGNPWAMAAGTAYRVSKFAGDQLGKVVYGEKPGESGGQKFEDIPEDEVFEATTGNSVVDWIFGI